MGIVSLIEVKDHIVIDFDDPSTNRLLERLIRVSEPYLVGALGSNYPKEDERVKEMALIVISDLYESRDLYDRISGSARKLFEDFALQIKMEMRRSNAL